MNGEKIIISINEYSSGEFYFMLYGKVYYIEKYSKRPSEEELRYAALKYLKEALPEAEITLTREI
jgi:hypothetical protein